MTSRIWDTSPNPGRIGTKHWCHVITQKYSVVYSHTRFLFFFYFPSHLLCSPFYSLPPSRNSDPGSHNRLFSPPTHYGSCLAYLVFCFREKISALSSLVDSRRIVLNHARRPQQLILFLTTAKHILHRLLCVASRFQF